MKFLLATIACSFFSALGCGAATTGASANTSVGPRKPNEVTGAHHVGLTVTKLDETARFFRDALGFETVREDPNYPSIFVKSGNLMVTLWQAEYPTSATPFNRKHNVGLHHLALGVASFEALEAVFKKVESYPGVVVEFAPEAVGDGPAKHTIFREPSGVRLELIHNPG